ncbi:MAG: hypothetical protein ACXVCJ_13435 [Polyangiales bacterium]
MAAAVLLVGGTAAAASLEVSARAGYGSAGSDTPTYYEPTGLATLSGGPDAVYSGKTSPYGGGVNLAGGLGVRLGIISFGVDGGTRSSSTSSPDPSITDMSRSAFFVGPYVHAYIPGVPIFDPWVGVGVQYVMDTQTYKAPTQGIKADWTLEHHGVALPLTVGVDYSLPTKILSFGPFFTFAPTFNAGGCAKVSAAGFNGNNFCTNESNDALKITKSKGYSSWIVGLNVRFTFPPP